MNKATLMENRKLAWLVLALAVVIGVLGFGGGKIKNLGREATQYYEKNIASDITLRVNAARSIVELGTSVLDSGDVALTAAQNALQAMDKAKTPAEKLAANTDLTSSIGMLYEAVHAETDEKKGGLLQGQWSEFTSRQNIINNAMAGYEKCVQKAHAAVRGFPASLLARMVSMPV